MRQAVGSVENDGKEGRHKAVREELNEYEASVTDVEYGASALTSLLWCYP